MRGHARRYLGTIGLMVGVALGVLNGCRVGNAQAPYDAQSYTGQTPITFEAEWSGTTSQTTDPGEWIITEPDHWTEVWQVTHPEMPPPPAPSVDFSHSMVIGVALGERRTGGYEVRITEITETDTELLVQVEELSPPPDAITIMMLTQPFHLVQIPRSSLPVRFEWNEPPPDASDNSAPSQFEGVY